MKKKRAIPYGYTFVNGELQIEENEAKIIRLIFSDYMNGISMSELAGKLTRLSIPYCEKRVQWNKCIIARIIDNEKYTGINGYLPIIDIEEYKEAQICKKERTKKQLFKDSSEIGMIRAKTVCQACGERMIRIHESRNRCPIKWKCSNPSCKKHVPITDEILQSRIQERLNLIIENPDLLKNPSWDEFEMDLSGVSKDTQELKRLCETNNYSDADLLFEILKMAEKRYAECDNPVITTTAKVSMAFANANAQEEFDSELFLQTVDAVLLAEDGTITLNLINNIEI